MKIIHLSDLHLGKRIKEFSMLEDQEFILAQITDIIDKQSPQAVIIAGDVYDKSVPSAEAVQLFDDFLCKMAERDLKVFVISGNHDSAERIAFGANLMDKSGIYMSPVYDGNVRSVELSDEFGKVCFYLLPFVKPANVRRFYEDENIESYTDAICSAVSHMDITPDNRNILITHQFVTGGERSESEDISVGGSDNVDVCAFEPFDYVALGHLHGPQKISRDTIRYCGTPLKYSFSEKDQKKSVTVLDVREKGNIEIETVPLVPRHDMREIRGTYNEVAFQGNNEGAAAEDYVHIILTDEEDVPDAIGRLRSVYPNIMQLSYDNTRTRKTSSFTAVENPESKSENQLFEEFFEKINGMPMSEEQKKFTSELFESIREATI